eukprot:TRINITY_DN11503_c0_g1_i2.p1 TRINITY_DN11503_c0_g1~~TRINITY_DN11503_c0_g1_i2.p1  ORF type:complete len:262 (+),score=80.46 TRINITY_DN11503_c0_g1_i2:492-1277(+)
MKIKDIDFIDKYRQFTQLETNMKSSPCHTCDHLLTQYKEVDKRQRLMEQLEAINFMLSDDSLMLKPEFECRVKVLTQLNYINQDRVVKLKGKVAREVSTCDELIATELIFENTLTPLDAAESAALLSSLVFQDKSESKPQLVASLIQAKDTLERIGTALANIQVDCGLQLDPEQYLKDKINTNLMEVVYAWARGVPFSEVITLTDVPEGTVIRTIVRLDETCRDFRSAARIIGDPGLAAKMEEASQLIKRDIVFASSLYVT